MNRRAGFPRRRGVSLATALLVTLGSAAIAGAAGTAADPFYLGLLRDGRTSLARGDAAAAARQLRVACFGLLEQTDLLGECLVRLGFAQAATGDREGFSDTFDRLELVEERFQAYARAALTAEERRAFEDRVIDWIAPEVLRTIPAFAVLAQRRADESLGKLPPRERQKEIERRAAADPENPRWRVLLAEEEVARSRWKEALARLKGVPGEAEQGRAGCLTGLALARLERCREAAAPLLACRASSRDAELVEARLGCLLEGGDLDGARALWVALDPSVASQPAVRRLQERLAKAEKRRTPAPSTAPAETPVGEAREPAGEKLAETRQRVSPAANPPAKSERAPVAPSGTTSQRSEHARAAIRPSAEEEKALRDARELLRTAKRREELVAGMSSLGAISDRHPGNADLALAIGEIAYRSGQWQAGADAFARAAPEGPTDPTLRFYMAVCLYESGNRASAAQLAATGLERLQRTPFVEDYLRRIRAALP